MKSQTPFFAGLLCAALGWANPAAALLFDQDITPDVIFGSGNANGGWTVDRNNGVELGLRGKVRFDLASGAPENTFNSDGAGSYSFDAGVPAGQAFNTGTWSVEWSVNTDFQNSGGLVLDDLVYVFGVDSDPGLGTSFSQADIINVIFADHATGDGSTPNGGGTVAANAGQYAAQIASDSVAQNSWRADFLLGGAFDPNLDATYDFYLAAFDANGAPLARTDARIVVGNGGSVPAPGSLALLAAGLLCLRRRARGVSRRQRAARTR
tara:strand:+ start:3446 stop:4243 length:798 start_codon:yes stop_codon:yes gene_type:complete